MDPSHRQMMLGTNKQSKQIRKPSPPPPPQIYNISKNDFRSVVQQLTGSPSRDHLRPQPPPRPRPPSSRLLMIRPPPLAPLAPPPHPNPNPNPNPNHNPRAPAWASSPVSAYMRYLESSLLGPASSSRHQPPPPFPSPRSLALLSPRGTINPNSFLSPRPTSLPSLNGYLNLLSPRSPYPLISPGFPYPPPPLVFSPLTHPETLGAGTGHGLPAPPSPGFFFPPSPSGFLPSRSPRWRDKS